MGETGFSVVSVELEYEAVAGIRNAGVTPGGATVTVSVTAETQEGGMNHGWYWDACGTTEWVEGDDPGEVSFLMPGGIPPSPHPDATPQHCTVCLWALPSEPQETPSTGWDFIHLLANPMHKHCIVLPPTRVDQGKMGGQPAAPWCPDGNPEKVPCDLD